MASILKTTIKGSATLVGMNALSLLISLIVTIILVSFLPQKEYGLFILAIATYNIGKIFLNFGLSGIVVSEIARYRGMQEVGKIKRILKEFTGFQFVTSLLLSIVVFFMAEQIAAIYSQKVVDIVRILAIMLFFEGMRDVFRTALHGYSKFFMYSSVQIVETMVRLIFTYVFLVQLNGGVYWAVVAYLIGVLASTLVFFIHYLSLWRSIGKAKTYESGLFWTMFRDYGKYAPMDGILKKVRDNIPEWIINFFWSLETVAAFGFARKIYTPLRDGFGSVEKVLLPTMSEQATRDPKKFYIMFQKGTKYAFWASCALLIPAILAAPWLVEFIAPKGYSDSVWVLQILFFSLLMTGLSNPQNSTLFALKSQKYLFYSRVVVLFVFLVTAIPLSMYLGAIGMALSLLVRNISGMLTRMHFLKKTSPEFRINISGLFKIDDYDKQTLGRSFKKIKRTLRIL